MEITWLGHSAFRLRGRDVVIVTDPYGGDDLGYPDLSVAAGVITISHDHPHHANRAAATGTPRVLNGPGEYEIGGAIIWGVQTPRLPETEGGPDQKNTAYVIRLEDLSICHLGDLGRALTAEQLTQIKDCDILLLPVGGHCTIGAAQAAEVVAQVEPKLVVPMHYGTSETKGHLDLDEVSRFCREMGVADVVAQNRLNVTASNVPSELTVVLLEQRR